MRVCPFDQLDLPGAVPFFQTLLALNGKLNLIELLIIDQSVNGVSLAESADRIRAMLVDAADEIVGDTDVKRSAYIAGNNVDPVGCGRCPCYEVGGYWIARSSRAMTGRRI